MERVASITSSYYKYSEATPLPYPEFVSNISFDNYVEVNNMFFHRLALGHRRHGARCEHHFQLLQVL
jgi:hypothetical protein